MKRWIGWTAMAGTACLLQAVSAAATLGAQEPEHTHELGSVQFPVSCNAAAQAQMHQAVAMLHSFWFPEARRTFQAAGEADPGCGIAYWGVAMSYFGNPMGGGSAADQQPLGLAAAEKGAQMGARSDRDQGYIDAALALFRDYQRLDNRTRMRAQEQAMAAVVAKHPEDQEAVIFHAIMMVANASPNDLTFARQKEAAAILMPMFEKQPQHPGLAHYIIHAFDAPPLASQALSAARRYADIAPDAPHAVHMPSHIFTRLGYWDESIRTNRRSADLDPAPAGKIHPFDYMVYAYLQKGQDDAALAVMREVGGDPSGAYTAAGLTSYNAAAIPARYALERNDWKSAAGLKVLGGVPNAEAVTRFARALGAARSGDVAAANTELQAIAGLIQRLSTTDAYWAHVVDAQRMAITAWVAQAQGNRTEAVRLARAGADKEDEVEKAAVTPGPLIPARELLGDLLMAQGQPAEALAAYEGVLTREPNRARTLHGAATAAKALGRNDVARRYYGELVTLMDPASRRPELAEAKAFLGSF